MPNEVMANTTFWVVWYTFGILPSAIAVFVVYLRAPQRKPWHQLFVRALAWCAIAVVVGILIWRDIAMDQGGSDMPPQLLFVIGWAIFLSPSVPVLIALLLMRIFGEKLNPTH